MDSSSFDLSLKPSNIYAPKFWGYFLNDLSKTSDLNERLVSVRNMKRQLETEGAMLPISRSEQFTITKGFLKDAVKSLEEEEICIIKELNKMQQPITSGGLAGNTLSTLDDLETSQHRQGAEEGDLQGRCFARTSDHKKNGDGISAVVESNLSGNSSSLYSQHLPMIETGLYRHESRMRGDNVIMSPIQGLASGDEHTLPNARDKGKGVVWKF